MCLIFIVRKFDYASVCHYSFILFSFVLHSRNFVFYKSSIYNRAEWFNKYQIKLSLKFDRDLRSVCTWFTWILKFVRINLNKDLTDFTLFQAEFSPIYIEPFPIFNKNNIWLINWCKYYTIILFSRLSKIACIISFSKPHNVWPCSCTVFSHQA